MGHDPVQTQYIKQQVELLQNENNRLRMESESLLKGIELLSVQHINTHEANGNTENFITVKRTGKNKIKLNHQQDSRIPLRNSFEIVLIKECQDKLEPNEKSISPSFDLTPSKERQKKQSTKSNKQAEANITNNQYKEPLVQRKARIVMGNIINIGKSCIDLDVKEIVISILPKRNIALTCLIWQVKNSLMEQCILNGFGFICNDNISRTHLWKDGIHLEDLGINIQAGNFVGFLNSFILSKSTEHS